MSSKRLTLFCIVAIAALLLTGCNPIPEPLQADLHDFASIFAMLDEGGPEPELYEEAILKFIDQCPNYDFRGLAQIDPDMLETPGQRAALEWVSIIVLIVISPYMEPSLGQEPYAYSRLQWAQENCPFSDGSAP